MKSIFKMTGFLSAAALVGLAGITQAQSGDAPPPAEASSDSPMDCCSGGPMSAMMGMGGGDDLATTQPSEHVDLDAKHQAAVDDLTVAYLSVQKSLVNDSADGVAEQFEKIDEAAHSLDEVDDDGFQSAVKKVSKAAHAEAKTLNAAREAFKPLSKAMVELAKLAPPSDEVAKAIYQVHCPMAKATWLQTSKEIANPYMGQSMPKCGELQATLKGGDEQ